MADTILTEPIEAHQKKLLHIFSDEYLFNIPPYQRPYSWTTEQADELLEDLQKAIDEKNTSYFMGALVLIKSPQHPKSEVIDGQQRLTTLAILFAVIRDLLGSSKLDVQKYIMQEPNEVEGTDEVYRLQLRPTDQAFFKKYVQEKGGIKKLIEYDEDHKSDAQANIYKNAVQFYKTMEDWPDKKRQDLLTFIIRSCYVVVVCAASQDSAFRIFSVLNNRGLDLSATDILKAEVIGALPAKQQKEYTKEWEDVENDLGRARFEELFSHIRMIYKKTKIYGTLVKEFKEHVNPTKAPEAFIKKTLIPYGQIYSLVLANSWESKDDADEINRYIAYLNRLDNSDWVPPVLRYFDHYRSKPKNLLKFIKAIETLAYGMFVMRFNINQRVTRYADILTALEDDRDVFAPKSQLLLTKEEKGKFVSSLNQPIYEEIKVRLPLLLRLDNMIADDTAKYNRKKITIEHVLPQNPDDDSRWIKDFSDEAQRRQMTNLIGNLVLLSRAKNAQAQNYEFKRKIDEYFKKGNKVDNFALTKQVLVEKKWTPETVLQRQQHLLDILCEEWGLPELDVEDDLADSLAKQKKLMSGRTVKGLEKVA